MDPLRWKIEQQGIPGTDNCFGCKVCTCHLLKGCNELNIVYHSCFVGFKERVDMTHPEDFFNIYTKRGKGILCFSQINIQNYAAEIENDIFNSHRIKKIS